MLVVREKRHASDGHVDDSQAVISPCSGPLRAATNSVIVDNASRKASWSPGRVPPTRSSVNSSCVAAVFPSSSKVASYGAPLAKFDHTGSSENRPSSLDTGAAAPSDTPFSATKRRTVARLGRLPEAKPTTCYKPLLPLYAVVASAHALALSSTFVSFINSQSLPTTKPAPEVNSPEEAAAAADMVAAPSAIAAARMGTLRVRALTLVPVKAEDLATAAVAGRW
ncbi:hypothetical protein C8F01DRAFT_1372092 [Mycena amicta]|nr:hypothetical protein C8F01DRAFT_1372092 [Mycena amicta]